MVPKAKYTREGIVQNALKIVQTEGAKGLTARSLAKTLGGSACPIFTLFSGMEEVYSETLAAAHGVYRQYLAEETERGNYPPYKASGMGYIRFAREKRELFKLLFMRDRSNEQISENREEIMPLLRLLEKNLGLTEEEAYRFHLEMWIYVHGLATMVATQYLPWDDGFISGALTDIYVGLKHRFTERTHGGDSM